MEISDEYWVYAQIAKHQQHIQKFKQTKIGKWLVFSDNRDHDENWRKIKQATEDGFLGVSAKAATAKPNPNANSMNEKVICVYTYNWLDVNDVYRVEKNLRAIGIEQTLYYKTDSDTIAGLYKSKGAKNISKYVSKAIKSYQQYALGSLHGVGSDTITILQEIGIKNFDDLIAFDTSKKLVGYGISTERINKLKLSALAQIEKKIYKLSCDEFPEGEIVHFDIETDLGNSFINKKIWNIAIHHRKTTKRFFAKTWEQEKNILEDFIQYIKNVKNPILISYSGVGFDKNILYSALKRHDLDSEYFIECVHYDLCTIIRQNYVLPIDSFGLKSVGRFLGYDFKNNFWDGLYVANEYIRCQQTGKKLPKNIFNYIDDDVKSMDFIMTQLKKRQDIIHIV